MIKKIINNFNLKGDFVNVKTINSGIINNTFVITMNDNGNEKKYIIQKINTTVLSFQNFVSCLKSKITSVEIHGCVKQNNTKFKIFNDLNV